MNRKLWLLAVLLLISFNLSEAQQPNKIYRIGVLTNAPRSSRIEAFRQGMKELGYVEGKHFALEIRRAEEKPDRIRNSRPNWSVCRLT